MIHSIMGNELPTVIMPSRGFGLSPIPQCDQEWLYRPIGDQLSLNRFQAGIRFRARALFFFQDDLEESRVGHPDDWYNEMRAITPFS